MKIVRFDAENGPRVGVVEGDSVIDLVATRCPYADVQAIIEGGNAALSVIVDHIANVEPQHKLDSVVLLPPLQRPGKYLAIGMNYRKHVAESEKLGVAAPKQQVWFNEQISCISGPYDDIDPGVTEKLDYEVELGVVIGRPAKGVKTEKAESHIFGYFVANDVSARDWQFHSPTFTMGKSFDTHGPIGPWIVTRDEVADPHNLDLRCYVNDELRQSNNTSEMIHSIFEQIAYLSTAFTLEPGDIIATGTPEGVGVAMEPPAFLQPGDVVRCEIAGIGTIKNCVKRSY